MKNKYENLLPTVELPFDSETNKLLRSYIINKTYREDMSYVRVAYMELLAYWYSKWSRKEINELLQGEKNENL